MTEDFLERMRMADQDDDDKELKQLKQLRQVWLAMPDEEPPTRGLDALMAAARTKAVEMQPKATPWWQRMFAAMVRPPALALATIVVVAGGAVLISRHRDDLDATATAPAVMREDHKESAAGSAAPQGARGGETLDQTINGAADFERRSDSTPPEAVHATPAVPKPPAQITHPAVAKKPAPPPPAKPKVQALEDGATEDAMAPKHITISKGEGTKAPRTEPPAEPKPEVASPAKPMAPPASRAPTRSGGAAQLATDSDVQNQPESLDSMLRRAHEAATRSDCATAKSIATQIAARDVAYFRNTVARDAVVAKCLPVAAE